MQISVILHRDSAMPDSVSRSLLQKRPSGQTFSNVDARKSMVLHSDALSPTSTATSIFAEREWRSPAAAGRLFI